jgi:hypothetical protein
MQLVTVKAFLETSGVDLVVGPGERSRATENFSVRLQAFEEAQELALAPQKTKHSELLDAIRADSEAAWQWVRQNANPPCQCRGAQATPWAGVYRSVRRHFNVHLAAVLGDDQESLRVQQVRAFAESFRPGALLKLRGNKDLDIADGAVLTLSKNLHAAVFKNIKIHSRGRLEFEGASTVLVGKTLRGYGPVASPTQPNVIGKGIDGQPGFAGATGPVGSDGGNGSPAREGFWDDDCATGGTPGSTGGDGTAGGPGGHGGHGGAISIQVKKLFDGIFADASGGTGGDGGSGGAGGRGGRGGTGGSGMGCEPGGTGGDGARGGSGGRGGDGGNGGSGGVIWFDVESDATTTPPVLLVNGGQGGRGGSPGLPGQGGEPGGAGDSGGSYAADCGWPGTARPGEPGVPGGTGLSGAPGKAGKLDYKPKTLVALADAEDASSPDADTFGEFLL